MFTIIFFPFSDCRWIIILPLTYSVYLFRHSSTQKKNSYQSSIIQTLEKRDELTSPFLIGEFPITRVSTKWVFPVKRYTITVETPIFWKELVTIKALIIEVSVFVLIVGVSPVGGGGALKIKLLHFPVSIKEHSSSLYWEDPTVVETVTSGLQNRCSATWARDPHNVLLPEPEIASEPRGYEPPELLLLHPGSSTLKTGQVLVN